MKLSGLMSKIPNEVTQKVSLSVLAGKKHAPAIMFGAGVVGVVTTVVLASKATLDLDRIIDEARANAAKAEEANRVAPEKFSEKDLRNEIIKIRTVLATDVVKLYGPAVIVGIMSVCALTGSHVILTKRNGALIAAYKAVESGFAKYRENVVKEFGEEKDRELRVSATTRAVVDDDEHGGTVEHIKTYDENGLSMYARIYDERNPNWQPSMDYNIRFLQIVESQLNRNLDVFGYVMLNDLWTALGMGRTTEGQIVGWVKKGGGDGYIDLGIWRDKAAGEIHEVMMGHQKAIWLDPNVDGVVFDKINELQ